MQETGRLVVTNLLAGGAVGAMNVDAQNIPDKYVPWFERVMSIGGVEFTGIDLTNMAGLIVAVLVITNTAMAIYERRKKKRLFEEEEA